MRHRRIFYKVQSSEFKVQIVLRAMWQRDYRLFRTDGSCLTGQK